jgi:hypothetical protein
VLHLQTTRRGVWLRRAEGLRFDVADDSDQEHEHHIDHGNHDSSKLPERDRSEGRLDIGIDCRELVLVGYDSKVSIYNNTNAGGSATLVTPNTPILLSVWASLAVELPTNQTTVQRTIAGEAVNVTVYWQPTYVSFAGWALVTPPQTSAKVILHYQQPMYYVTPYAEGIATPGAGQASTPTGVGVAVPGSSGAQSSSSGTGQRTLVYPDFGPGGISQPPVQTQSTIQTIVLTTGSIETTSNPGLDNTLLLGAVGVAVALAALSLLIVAVRSRKRPVLRD